MTAKTLLAFSLVACANPSAPRATLPAPATAQLSVESTFAGSAAVRIGDSILEASSGWRSPCMRWDSLPGPVVVHTAIHGPVYGYNFYVWPVIPPETNLFVSIQQLEDSSVWALWTYVNAPCGDTLLSRPGARTIAPLHSLE